MQGRLDGALHAAANGKPIVWKLGYPTDPEELLQEAALAHGFEYMPLPSREELLEDARAAGLPRESVDWSYDEFVQRASREAVAAALLLADEQVDLPPAFRLTPERAWELAGRVVDESLWERELADPGGGVG